MIIYKLISMGEIVCKFRRKAFDISKEVNALGKNMLTRKFQKVFHPIEVVRYKQGGLRSQKPPFEYHVLNVQSAKQYWICRELGLGIIRAKIDTTFREDKKIKKQENPFPKTWTPNLGISNKQQQSLSNARFKQLKRQEKWINLLVKKGQIKLIIAKVAVILTSYNRPTLVQKAIRSVLNQSYLNWHLYIVDNNSNVMTRTILKKYKNKYPTKITLHFLNTPDHRRLSKCWLSYMINWAIRKGREPYITLLTDDCWLHKDKLKTMTLFMNNHPSAWICYGTQIIVNLKGREMARRPANRALAPHQGAGILDHNQVLFRRKLIKRIGYWNESKLVMGAPDADFWNRIPFAKYPIKAVTDYYLEHSKRFQHFFYARKGNKNQLKTPMVME